jgi:hypothetical protein
VKDIEENYNLKLFEMIRMEDPKIALFLSISLCLILNKEFSPINLDDILSKSLNMQTLMFLYEHLDQK